MLRGSQKLVGAEEDWRKKKRGQTLRCSQCLDARCGSKCLHARWDAEKAWSWLQLGLALSSGWTRRRGVGVRVRREMMPSMSAHTAGSHTYER